MKFHQSDLVNQLPKQFFADLVQKVNSKIDQGADVINLGQGNPDQPTFPHIVETMQKASAKPDNHKYSSFRGLPAFKKAAANFYDQEYDVPLDYEKEICVLGGSKIGLVELPLAVMNPGELLLLPDPGYPDYLSGATLGNVSFETFPLTIENNFLPDYSKINPEIARKAKFIYLNYPNNPTGAVATKEFWAETVSFAKKYNIGVISDIAYGAIGYDNQDIPSFLQTPGAKDVGIELYTFSKTFNMAGWRLAFAAGNADIIEALNILQDHLFVSVFPAIQEAGIEALGNPEVRNSVNQLIQIYQGRRDTFIQKAASIGWHAYIPGGTFYVWMPTPAGFTSEEFADLLLENAHVAVAPGRGFGSAGEGYVRIGLLVSPERLVEAINRIEKLNLFQ